MTCMKATFRQRLPYLILSVLLFGAEVYIGLCVSGWVRSYFGDTLVVILLWTIVRVVCPKGLPWLSGAVMAFAVLVELSQLIPLCDLLGIQNKLIRVLMGTSFAWGDMIAYAAGCILTAGHDLYAAGW